MSTSTSTSSGPGSVRNATGRPHAGPQSVAGEVSAFLAFLGAHRQWAPVVIAYLSAWWLPFYWCFREDRWWGRWDSAIIYQPFVPLGVLFLLWADRTRIAAVWDSIKNRTSERKRRGTILLLVLGCVLLFLAHLVHVAAIAVVALILMAAGVVVRLYSPVMLRALFLPFLFFLTMMPPPSSLVSKAERFFESGAARAIATLMRGEASGRNVLLGTTQVIITPSTNGLNIALMLAAALLLVGMRRRMRMLTTLLMMTLGIALGLSANFLRIIALAATATPAPALSDFIKGMNPLLIVVPTFLLTLYLEKRLRPSLEWLGKRLSWLGALTAQSEKMTETLADTAGRTIGKRVVKVGRASTNFTENLLRALERPFKKRRRNRW